MRFALIVALVSSCVGSIDGGSEGQPPPPDLVSPPGTTPVTPSATCQARDPGPSPLRRLTTLEYDGTIRELFHRDLSPARTAGFPGDSIVGGFTTVAQGQSASALLAQKHWEAAEDVARNVSANLTGVVPCDPARGDRACADRFIDTWGKRAWRRPVAVDEKTAMLKVFDAGTASEGFTTGIRMLMQAMLQAPQFLFRLEFGLPAAGATMVRLTPWETASRLSYLVWGTMPDETLFAAADANTLSTNKQIEDQARRMLKDARAREHVLAFYDDWLTLSDFDDVSKLPRYFPGFDNRVHGPLYRPQMTSFVDHVTWNGGTMTDLFTAPFVMMERRLAPLYGMTTAGSGFSRIDVEAARGGLLGQPGFLAAHAKPSQTDVVTRGKFVRTKILCGVLPPPPDDVPPAPEPNGKSTARERAAVHAAAPACRGCHALMDPIGLALENYDGIGRWQTVENGKAIDVSGQINGVFSEGSPEEFAGDSSLARSFTGAAELGAKLAASGRVQSCFTTQWFRFSYGRLETEADGCSVGQLRSLLLASNYKLSEFMVALTQTDAFLYRRAGGAR